MANRGIHSFGVTTVCMLCLSAFIGCGEINSMLDAGAGKDAKKPAAEAASGGGAQSARQKLDDYYNRESRTVEEDPNNPIVSCNVRGSQQYMRKSDCTLRGGVAS